MEKTCRVLYIYYNIYFINSQISEESQKNLDIRNSKQLTNPRSYDKLLEVAPTPVDAEALENALLLGCSHAAERS
jgi:hypothetical protein